MNRNSGINVLVVGATGFLGPALVEELSLAGFHVVCGVRNLEKAGKQLYFPNVKLLKVDMGKDLDPEIWLSRIRENKIDVVVNNVGIANSFGNQSMMDVNVHAPMALFKAIRSYHREDDTVGHNEPISPRVIQISTTGVEWPDCDKFIYPASKLKLEKQLASLHDLAHIIIRPNVIYEPERGHLLLEQIAKIPIVFYIGEEAIQPVHCREVAIGVARLVVKKMASRHTILRASGPQIMTWKDIFCASSEALGKQHFCYCSVPLKLAQIATYLLQKLPKKFLLRFGILSKMDPDTMVMMTKGSTGSNKAWLDATDMLPIYLNTSYRGYGKGAEGYAAYIEGIRNS